MKDQLEFNKTKVNAERKDTFTILIYLIPQFVFSMPNLLMEAEADTRICRAVFVTYFRLGLSMLATPAC